MTAVEEVGRPMDASYRREVLRAEMVETINQYCFEHAAKITEALLVQFDVTLKPIKEKHRA